MAYSYGDEQHLEEALDRIFRPGRQGGVPKRNIPTLIGDAMYCRQQRLTAH
jgi:hypothetical protein